MGPAADNTKTPPFGGGGGGVGSAADDTKTPQLWGTGGELWGGLCDRCPTRAPSIGNLLGFSYG